MGWRLFVLSMGASGILIGGGLGCKGPDCQKAVDHTFSILGKEAEGLAPGAKEEALQKIAQAKAESLKDCKAGKPQPLTKAKHECIMASKTKVDLEKCEK